MKYETQGIAYWYFVCAMALFVVQVLVGALAATVYAVPNFLAEILPFNILRMIHTNALIVWLLIGFMGATYYLVPEETETELFSPLLAKIQFWMFFGAAGVAVDLEIYRGVTHEFIKMGRALPEASQALQAAADALKGAWET